MYTLLVVLGTITTTVVATLLVLNLLAPSRGLQQPLQIGYSVDSSQFRRTMSTLLGPPLVSGNAVTALINGREIFPAMLEAIRSAESTITLETFIYWSGDIGQKFADALSERARQGLHVHVLLDGLGSLKIEQRYIEQMQAAGVAVEMYHPVRWHMLARVNNRTHRKLLVTDGRIGFIGGVGIADAWAGDAETPQQWRDNHYRVEGPAVGQLQAAFLDNWITTRSDLLHDEHYFPELQAAGDSLLQICKSSSRGGSESVRLMYLLSIAAARKSIRLATAYFVPDDVSVQMLCDASRRGVEVQIIVPSEHTDTQVVRRASRARWGKLLQAGCALYEYQPAMYHCKLMIVDDLWVSVGSANFDDRSFRLNDEANMNVLDAQFAASQVVTFDRDRAVSRQVSYEQWKNRPWRKKLLDRSASLLRPQL